MSASLYRYTEDCEGVPCPGDCDMCNVNEHGYTCEPEKNTVCSKRRCWVNGGECKITSRREFAESEKLWCCHLRCPHIGDGVSCDECRREYMEEKR